MTDFQWFKDNQSALYEKYGNTFLAIKDKQVIGSYSSYAEGVNETAKVEPVGTFIIQQCGQDESSYTNYISSMNFIH